MGVPRDAAENGTVGDAKPFVRQPRVKEQPTLCLVFAHNPAPTIAQQRRFGSKRPFDASRGFQWASTWISLTRWVSTS